MADKVNLSNKVPHSHRCDKNPPKKVCFIAFGLFFMNKT